MYPPLVVSCSVVLPGKEDTPTGPDFAETAKLFSTAAPKRPKAKTKGGAVPSRKPLFRSARGGHAKGIPDGFFWMSSYAPPVFRRFDSLVNGLASRSAIAPCLGHLVRISATGDDFKTADFAFRHWLTPLSGRGINLKMRPATAILGFQLHGLFEPFVLVLSDLVS